MPTEAAKKSLPDRLDAFVLLVGRWLSWANGLLVLVIVLQVVLRYGFGRGLVLLEELEWHLYALAFMFGLSYALTTDAHVRVDLLHERFPPKVQQWIEVLGTLFLLLPFIWAVLYHSTDFFLDSWVHNERSSAPLGLPFRWAIKAVIPLSFAMLAIAAISRVIRSLTAIFASADGTD
ncbi:MAG: TRAP transporter small permease subunit [Desulfosarcinaceae bacterium]|nr:TRAP transporter small permease subunit [Desulfosarcinaceae bacterium]